MDRPAVVSRRSAAGALILLALLSLLPIVDQAPAAAANPYQLCLYRGSLRPDLVAAHEQWVGRRMAAVLEFIPMDAWSSIRQPGNRVRTWSGSGYDVVFTTPMLPRDGVSTLAAGAAGAYDAHWRSFAQAFVREGRPDARIRLGHEGNHTWYPWTATGGKEAQYAAYYRRIVTVLRSVPGTRFRFTWNVLSNGQYADVERMYPGDAYVDVVSLDLYDGVFDVRDFEERWRRLRTQKYGIDWLIGFAARHNKPMAFDEWGLVKSINPDARDPRTDSGDNTVYINRMLDLFATERVAYGCYFDVRTTFGGNDSRIMNGPYPNATATYRARLAGAPAAGAVVLVTGNAATLPAKDAPIRNRLVGLGRTVRLLDDDAVTSTALTGAGAVVISSSVAPAKVPAWLATLAVPVLDLEAHAQPTLRMATSAREDAAKTTLRVVDAAHPLAAGRTGDVVVQSSVPLGSGVPAPGARVVARPAGSTTAAVYAIERGAALTTGTAPARRVGFFFSYDSPAALTTHGWALFDAAIRWLGGP